MKAQLRTLKISRAKGFNSTDLTRQRLFICGAIYMALSITTHTAIAGIEVLLLSGAGSCAILVFCL